MCALSLVREASLPLGLFVLLWLDIYLAFGLRRSSSFSIPRSPRSRPAKISFNPPTYAVCAYYSSLSSLLRRLGLPEKFSDYLVIDPLELFLFATSSSTDVVYLLYSDESILFKVILTLFFLFWFSVLPKGFKELLNVDSVLSVDSLCNLGSGFAMSETTVVLVSSFISSFFEL